MPRHSPISTGTSRARILAAARAVAARQGAAHVSLDAIAREAGLSKSGVLYNFASKRALMAALLDEMLAEHRALDAQVPQGTWRRDLRRHFLSVTTMDCVNSDLSMAILAIAATEPDLLDPLRGELEEDLARITDETADPATAHVIFFALQGLRFHKLLNLPDGGPPVRDRVHARLQEMIENAP